jgi:hypothetical protein
MQGNTALSLDLETLGTEPGCGILEIGFCSFSTKVLQARSLIQETGRFFTITLEDNLRHRMAVDPSTVDWWDYSQGGVPKFSKVSLQSALAQTADAMNECWKKGIKDIWCKPTTFDIPILAEAMDALGIERPQQLRKKNFRHWQCFATLRRVATSMAYELKVHPEFEKQITHNALNDAVDQAVQANMILTVLPAWREGHLAVQRLQNIAKTELSIKEEKERLAAVEEARKQHNLRRRKARRARARKSR